MPGQRSPDVIQVNLRLSKNLHKRLESAAKAKGRSLNAEMVLRLMQTFHREKPDEILEEAKKHEEEAIRIHRNTQALLDDIKRGVGGKGK